jgi:hypothetical protein
VREKKAIHQPRRASTAEDESVAPAARNIGDHHRAFALK